MNKFIVETDLGHDPDDFFTICHLIAAGHQIAAMSLVPGSPEQVRLACFIRKQTGQDFKIGVAKPNAKQEKIGVHERLMAQYSPIEPEHDGSSEHVLVNAFKQNQNIEVLIIGPAIGISKTVRGCKISNLTFQGGFLPYSLYRPTVSLPQFEGKESIATFNFNGCRDGVAAVDDADIAVRRFVGKNVCHTIIFNKDKLSLLSKPRCEASNLYLHCMALYLEKHDEKKFHDPTALACHLYPQIGMWFRGKPVRRSGEWSTETGNDYVLADVDKEKLWDVLLNWS